MLRWSATNRIYGNGIGVTPSASIAIALYERAAEAGDITAAVTLGSIFLEGDHLHQAAGVELV
jgi:TPR repeat protein